jgi:hypothetical protein
VIFIKPNDNDAFTIGLETENTTANWLAGDNFHLFYYGPSDDSQELNQLRLAISEAEQVNTGVKQIMGLLAVDAIAEDENRGVQH